MRPATPDDLPALDQIMWRASWSNIADRPILAQIQDRVRARADLIATTWVVLWDDQISGFASVEHLDETWELDAIFVDPPAMRKGLAKTLMTQCLTYARSCGAGKIWVTANRNALGFYTNLGFEMIDPEHLPGPRMVLALP